MARRLTATAPPPAFYAYGLVGVALPPATPVAADATRVNSSTLCKELLAIRLWRRIAVIIPSLDLSRQGSVQQASHLFDLV